MDDKDERGFRNVCFEMSNRTIALASQIIGEAVAKGVKYKLACNAIKMAMYQGMFSAVLNELKMESKIASDLRVEDAISSPKEHETVAHEIVRLTVDHLRVVDNRYVWSVNIAKRNKKLGEK